MIKNSFKNTTLTKKKIMLNSAFSKTIGLMFSKKIKDTGYIFRFNKEQNIPLHMFFVFYPIDVLWLNKDKEIIFLKENFKPFTTINPKIKAKYVIELPQGKIKKSKTKIKDKIVF